MHAHSGRHRVPATRSMPGKRQALCCGKRHPVTDRPVPGPRLRVPGNVRARVSARRRIHGSLVDTPLPGASTHPTAPTPGRGRHRLENSRLATDRECVDTRPATAPRHFGLRTGLRTRRGSRLLPVCIGKSRYTVQPACHSPGPGARSVPRELPAGRPAAPVRPRRRRNRPCRRQTRTRASLSAAAKVDSGPLNRILTESSVSPAWNGWPGRPGNPTTGAAEEVHRACRPQRSGRRTTGMESLRDPGAQLACIQRRRPETDRPPGSEKTLLQR